MTLGFEMRAMETLLHLTMCIVCVAISLTVAVVSGVPPFVWLAIVVPIVLFVALMLGVA